MRSHLAQELPESHRAAVDLGMVDLGIKDRVRLLRLPNTVHELKRPARKFRCDEKRGGARPWRHVSGKL